MDKDTYVLNFMGRSTIGKSRIISTCIQDKEIGTYIHKDNINGKTKTNIIYVINYDKDNTYKFIPKVNYIFENYLTRTEDKVKFELESFKKAFDEVSSEKDFEGIEEFINQIDDIEELKTWIKKYIKRIQKHLIKLVELEKCENENQKILFYCKLFEENLIYNKLFDIEIELKASKKFKKVLRKYELKRIILIDTRGVFDVPDKLQRSFTKYNPDINIFIFDEKGMTDHLLKQIYDELEPMFGKSFEICIRTTTPLSVPVLSDVDNCIHPTGDKNLTKKFDTIINFLKQKNVLEGNTVFDIRLREQLGTILPEIPNKNDYELEDQEVQKHNDKYDRIVCALFDKVIGLKKREEEAIAIIKEKCKDPYYKKTLIDSVIDGKERSIWIKYAKRCLKSINGEGNHLTPKPQAETIQRHIKNLFFEDNPTRWAKREYMCNIVTYEAANLINEAIKQIREIKDQLSDEQLSEYIFILKNSLSACQNSLAEWQSYVFFKDRGVNKKRIPSKYYYKAYSDTVVFSKGGTIYYTIYDELDAGSSTKCHKSSLLNCIIRAVTELMQEKLNIEKITINDSAISK
ncbi:hypothetical protein [Dethiothermospora halolimnae]|uniref:hypothetical protein n=1 Tax=Dethiothermospora halolimnae TaxID=3114390 RepID=UPI003CCB9A52